MRSPTQIALSRQQHAGPERAAARAAARIDEESQRTAVAAARAALEKKAEDVVVLDLRGVSGYTDFLVGSGGSDRQLEAIAESVEQELTTNGHRVIGSEGQRGGRWVLLDFGDVVMHVFHGEERAHYDLEGLWADAPRIEVE